MRWLKIALGFFMHKVRAGGHPSPTPLTEGTTAPAFDLPDETGRRHRLQDYLGKRVILWFYPRARTPG